MTGSFSEHAGGCGTMDRYPSTHHVGAIMSKRGRKRRSRKGNGANHGKRPNA